MKSEAKKSIQVIEPKSDADGQLAIPIKKPKNELVNGFKRRVNKSVTYAGVIPYWRNFYFVLSFMVSLFTSLVLGVFLFFYYDKFPVQVPLIYSQASKLWSPINKEYLIALPVIVLVFCLLNTLLTSKIFQFDRRLVLMLNVSVVLACVFLLVALSQIFSLLLVF